MVFTASAAAESASTFNWPTLLVAVVAVVIAAASFMFTVARARQQTRESKAATFLVLQRALIEPEMQKGREVLNRPDVSAELFNGWKTSQIPQLRGGWDLAGRAMATLDVLALHAELGVIDQDVVVEEWGLVLRQLRPGFDAYRASREDGAEIWQHLEDLVAEAENQPPRGMLTPMSDTQVRARPQGHPDTSTIFVLGLLGLSGSVLFGACAWYFGNRLLAKYDAEPGRWRHRGWAQAGQIMGIIGTVLSVVVIAMIVVALVMR